ncbi:MAG: WbqC family protein [Cytophagaceae bacterium]|nr:WbqC family protein [Cytophagaceae bacterium]
MSGKTVVILQSNYIPWKGYFDLINSADEFIFYDDVQYTKNDWRNRNKIKTSEGLMWLTIPTGDDIKRKIYEVEIKDQSWKKKHKQIFVQYYKRASFFEEYKFILDFLYDNSIVNLSEYNQRAVKYLADILGMKTKFSDSSAYRAEGERTERLIKILQQAGAEKYVSGPTAKGYLQEELISEAKIKLEYFDYSGYPQYRQLHGAFVHEVSILDLIFNMGKDATKYLKTFKQ